MQVNLSKSLKKSPIYLFIYLFLFFLGKNNVSVKFNYYFIILTSLAELPGLLVTVFAIDRLPTLSQ